MKYLHIIPQTVAAKFGLLRYYSGKICPKGHDSERYTSGWKCCECAFLGAEARKSTTYMADYYKKNRELCKDKVRKRAAVKREEIRAQQREKYSKNPDFFKMKSLMRRWSEPEKIKAEQARYRKENAAAIAATKAFRKAAKKTRTVGWQKQLTMFVFREASELCHLRKAATGIKWEVDHMIPLLGKKVSGLHVWNNLQVIPAYVNLKKGNRAVHLKPFQWWTLV